VQEVTNFSGSLDLDSDEVAIQKGDYVYALNFRNKNGVATNTPGTKPLPFELPAGRNRCIMVHADEENNRILYGLWNENNQHGLYAFYPQEERIEKIWVHELLGFTEHRFIARVGVLPIYKDGQKQQLLFYSNGIVAPRCINLNEIATLLPDPALYNEYFVSLVKPAPVMPLTVSLVSERVVPGNTKNLLENKVYTAKYRYVYRDFQRSKWSAESGPISAAYAETREDNAYVFNTIQYDWSADLIQFASGGDGMKYRKLIDYIEVAIKDGVDQPYRLVNRIRLGDNEQKNFALFKNESTYPAVANTPDLYDFVPRLSEVCTVIDNRVILLNNTEGFPHIDFQVVDASTITPHVGQQALNGRRMSFKNNSRNQIAVIFYDAANRSTGAYAPDELKISTPANFSRGIPLAFGKRFKLSGTLPPEIVAFQFAVAANQDVSFFIQGVATQVSYIKDTTDKESQVAIKRQIGYTGIKLDNGTYTHKKDGQNNYRLIGSEGANSKFYNVGEAIFEGGVDVDGKKIVIIRRETSVFSGGDETDMRDEPIGYTASGALIYYEGMTLQPYDPSRLPISEYISSANLGDTRYLGIDISNWYTSSKKSGSETSPNNQQYYNFQKGDRVDIISNRDGDYVGLLSLPILEYNNGVLRVPVTKELLSQTSYVLGPGTFIEIFTPKKPTDTTPFFEVGPRYKVVGNTFPDVYYDVTEGGTHLIKKQMFADGFETLPANYIFSMNPDNDRTFDIWETGLGRPNFVPEGRERIIKLPNQARASERLIENSIVNGTSSFPGLLEYTYPAEYGYIANAYPIQNNQVEEAGNVLMIEFSGEKVSVYVNRATFQDLGGRTIVGESDKVFGSYNALLGSHGCIHPASSVSQDSRNYCWNAVKGAVVRYSRDGLTPISEAKAKRFFYEMSIKLGKHKAVGGYDNFNNQYLLTFIPEVGDRVTIAWDEVDNRWKTFHSFAPEAYGQLGPRLISFVDGQLFIHEIGEKANTFYGTKYDTEVEPVFHDGFPNKNVQKSVSLVSTEKWSAPRILGDKVTNPRKTRQQTLWLLSHLEEVEDAFSTHIGKNIFTPNMSEQKGFVSGEEMRSSILRILLRLDPEVDYISYLYTLTLNSVSSKPENLKGNE
jgi:hypothetical protein